MKSIYAALVSTLLLSGCVAGEIPTGDEGSIESTSEATAALGADSFGGKTYCAYKREELFRRLRAQPKQDQATLATLDEALVGELNDGLRFGEIQRPDIAVRSFELKGSMTIKSPVRGKLVVTSEGGRAESVDFQAGGGAQLDFAGDGELVFDPSIAEAGLTELYVFTNGKNVVTMGASVPCLLVDAGRDSNTQGQLVFDAHNALPPKDNFGCVSNIGGTGNPDFLQGYYNCNDNIYAYGGNDTAYGYSGNDYLSMNQGSDTAYGNEDNDCIYGGQDNDQIYGGKGNDIISGDLGSDWCTGDNDFDSCAACEMVSCDQVVGGISCFPN